MGLLGLAAQIIASIDVAALVAALIPGCRVGRELTGSCPFHEDRTPSFSANPVSGKFYCFGCCAM